MAGRTDFNAEISARGRAGLERIAAAAGDGNLIVGWVDIGLHGESLVHTFRRGRGL